MIDTVRFRIPESMNSKLLTNWEYVISHKKDGKTWSSYKNYIDCPNGNKIRMTYYPQNKKLDPVPLISVEASLPKLVNGNNVKMLKDVIGATKYLESLISDPLDRKVDLSKSELDRVDFCYSHNVGEYVAPYIEYMFKIEHPTKKTKPYYPTNGVQFYCVSNTVSFYDKYEESENEDAIGILRQEISHVNKTSIRRTLGDASKPVFITDLTVDVVEEVFRKENKKLGIDDVVVADKAIALRVLADKYSTKKGMSLYGYMCASHVADNAAIVKMGISKQTISRNKKLIRDANLAARLTDQDVKLPSLKIDLKDQGSL